MSRSLSCIRATTALAAVAIVVAGCTAANNATSSQGADQSEQPYKTGYGFSSDGPTTDLYTELFGSSRRDDRNAAQPATATAATQPVQPTTAVASTQPVQAATASAPPRQVQPATATAAARQNKSAAVSAAARQVQPAPAAIEAAPQPAAPPPPPEPDTPVGYGITSNGPTTDLFTELFGPRRRDGQ